MAIAAVPAYNIVHQRPDGRPFHPRGEGNGYVLAFPGLRVYVAGDTENIPEMKDLQAIDIAFLPMNLPYTMTPEMTALAARTIQPRMLYPYHFSDTDPQRLVSLLQRRTRHRGARPQNELTPHSAACWAATSAAGRGRHPHLRRRSLVFPEGTGPEQP